MTRRDRECSYRVNSLEDILKKENIPDRGKHRWFHAMTRFCRMLDVGVWYLPAAEKPGLIWFSSVDDGYRREAFTGIRVKGTKNGTATGASFESAAKRFLAGFSGEETRIYRAPVSAPGPHGCVRTTYVLDDYRIPEFSSPEELFFRMSVAGIGKED